MTTHVIPLPWAARLPITTNKARNTHHHALNALKVEVRETVAELLARDPLPPVEGPVDLLLVWALPDRRRRDADGLGWLLKALADAIVTAGVLPDDSWQHVPLMGMRMLPPVKGQAGAMWLEIQEHTEMGEAA